MASRGHDPDRQPRERKQQDIPQCSGAGGKWGRHGATQHRLAAVKAGADAALPSRSSVKSVQQELYWNLF